MSKAGSGSTSDLPIELWLAIAENLDIPDLSALSRVDLRLQATLTPELYKRAAASLYDKRALFWGVLNGLKRTVKHALDAGIDPNLTWRSLSRADELEELFGIPGRKRTVPTARAHEPRPASRKPGIDRSEFVRAIENRNQARPGQPIWNWSALHLAVLNGDVDLIELLLDSKAGATKGSLGLCSCEAKPRTVGLRFASEYHHLAPKWTAFHVTVCCGQLSAAKTLLSRGVPVAMEEASNRSATGITALHVACMSGHLPVVKWLVERDQVIDPVDGECQTPLVYAYLYQRSDCFEYLLERGANINHVVSVNLGEYDDGDYDGEHWQHQTMLYSAIDSMRLEDACRLIELGAQANTGDSSNQPLLHLLFSKPWSKSTEKGQDKYGLKLLEHFIASGMDVDEPYGQTTALASAAGTANEAAVKILLDAGAAVDGDPNDWTSPLGRACKNGFQRSILGTVTLLLNAGACVNRPGPKTVPPLWTLEMNQGDSSEKDRVFHLLMEKGANPARGTSSASGVIQHTTPLEKMLKKGELAKFKALLGSCGNDPMKKLGSDDILAFWRAALDSKDYKILKHVLDMDIHGAVAKKDRFALSSLFSHQFPIPHDIVTRLLEQGADANYSSFGLTPLIDAIERNAEPIVIEQLLKHGADPNRQWGNSTPLSRVLDADHLSPEYRLAFVRLLLDAGVSVYQIIHKSTMSYPVEIASPTHLTLAIERLGERRGEIVELLLQRQPLHDHQHVKVLEYIQWTCGVGNWKALQVILNSEDAKLLVKENCTTLLHLIMDGLGLRQITVQDMDQTVCMVQFLIEQGPDLSTVRPDSQDSRTLREKLLATVTDPRYDSTTYCFSLRMEFGEHDDLPVFRDAEDTELCGSDCKTLQYLDRELENLRTGQSVAEARFGL